MRDGIWFAGLGGSVVALGVSVSLVSTTLADVMHERDRLRAAAARPTPTVTVTTAPVQRVPYPSPDRTPSPGRTVVDAGASARPGPAPDGVRAQERPAAGGTSRPGGSGRVGRPVPSPHPSPAPSCRPGVLTVQLPLGALPECAVTIGGN